MINIVYVDVYFCFNFLMDFFILYLMRLLLKEGRWWGKDCIAALIGAIYATIILIIGKGGFVESIFTYFVTPMAMSAISANIKTIKILLKRTGIIYFLTFIISGIINAIYYGSLTGRILLEKTVELQLGKISIWLIITVIIMCISVAKIAWNSFKNNLKSYENLYSVSVVIGNKTVTAKGLRDTGNQLVEPITRKPVFIIEHDLLRGIEQKALKPVFIPFNSVGKEHGLMEGFVGDVINIEGLCIEKPIIGIHKGKLSQENKYNMILPPNICKGESE